MPSLLPELAGKVNLIYIDPPFATGADFSFNRLIPDTNEDFTKEPSIIEQKAYRDIWGRGLDSYLQWFYEAVSLLHELLTEDGSIFVHLDWHVGHYAKAVLDEVFGPESFANEVVVNRGRRKNLQKQFQRIAGLGTEHDSVYVYKRSSATSFEFVKSSVRASDAQWQAFWRGNVERPTMQYELLGFKPTHGQFMWSEDRARRAVQNYQEFVDSGETDLLEYWKTTGSVKEFVRRTDSRRYPEYWLPPKEEGIIGDVWLDIQAYSYSTDYSTEKHEDFLRRIVEMASNEGDLVLDCFCGSGTTAAVAEKLGRQWIAADLGRFAISTTRKRLLSIPNVRPFVVQNLGKYERQQWQVAEFAQGDQRESASAQLAYRRFMLDLYRAQPLEDGVWLHGLRDGHFVHVGSVDAPVALGDVQNIVREVWRIRGPEVGGASNAVDILGWDFAFELNEVAAQMAAENNVRVHFKRIPREVLEKRAVEQGDIKFFELAALSVTVTQRDREGLSGVNLEHGPAVTLTLADYVVPPDDVPEDVQRAVKHWSQWIDYWAVDWDYQGDTFHNMAQTYRTRKDPKLQTSLSHTYAERGSYTVVVKVIDILGNDTTKTLRVSVGEGPHP